MSEQSAVCEISPDPMVIMEAYRQHPFADMETYKFFNQSSEASMQSRVGFNAGVADGDTPTPPLFTYDAIDIDQLLSWRDDLTALADQIASCDLTNESNLLLRENITNRLHEVGLLALTKMQSELDPNDPRYDTISFQLGQNMQEIYGGPERTHWQGVLGYKLQQLIKVEEHPDVPPSVADAWEYIKADLPQDLAIREPYIPQTETIEWYSKQLKARIAPAQQAVSDAIARGEVVLDAEGKLDANNIVAATKIALRARGAVQWDAKLTDDSNIDTTQSSQTIHVPKGRKMDLATFDGVIQGHEVDMHVMTRVNGDASGEPVLGGTGCNGYLSWNEGHGKANEALLKGKASTEASAFTYYLSGGLALGLDNGRGRNQAQTHALVWRMNYVSAFLKGKVNNDNYQDVKTDTVAKATKSLDRIFRGTDGKTPGVVFTKDVMTYYLGQVQVWRKWDADMALPEHERIAGHLLERSAKIDPLRPDHRRVAIAAFKPQLVR